MGHWHYVTYGLSELYEKEPESDPEWSGWGVELTSFYQAVGVTVEEKERMHISSTRDVRQELATTNPLLVTQPARTVR